MKNYRIISVLTHYLEMRNPPQYALSHEKEHCQVLKMDDPNTDFYRYLYKQVGEDVTWINRLVMEDQELFSIISDLKIEIYVLLYKGVPAGYAEIDRKSPKQIELVYFGINRRYRGYGLGKFLLGWIINKSWSYNPERLWLHTCELDHEAALPIFERAGFRIYDTNTRDQVILD